LVLKEIDPWTKKFAEKLVGVSKDIIFPKDVEVVVIVGGGTCKDALGLIVEYMPWVVNVIACDPVAMPVFSAFKNQNKQLLFFKDRFENFNLEILKGKKVFIEMSHVLQLFSRTDQLTMLRKVKEVIGPGGRAIIVDEIKRPGLAGAYDYILNRLFNRFVGRYNRQNSIFAFDQLIKDAGFRILKRKQFYRGSVEYDVEAI
jgi:ubiquinone/menaquinone biosynthesis C-methylase UbiE